MARVRGLVQKERPWLRAQLEALGLRVLPGEANYLLFRCPTPLVQPLRRRGIPAAGLRELPGPGPPAGTAPRCAPTKKTPASSRRYRRRCYEKSQKHHGAGYYVRGGGKACCAPGCAGSLPRRAWRWPPFKSQNMALNSYVTRDGLEMGRAQVVQAQAAGKEPDVRMNPILLKPSSDIGSQVIVGGEVRGQMSAAEYFRGESAGWCRRSSPPTRAWRRRTMSSSSRGRAARRRSTSGRTTS